MGKIIAAIGKPIVSQKPKVSPLLFWYLIPFKLSVACETEKDPSIQTIK